MTRTKAQLSLDDVLNEFSMEADYGRTTLERYLLLYPDYAPDIVELSREMLRTVEENRPLSAAEEMAVDTAWSKHQAAVAAAKRMSNPLENLDAAKQGELAHELGIPRPAIAAIRDGRVLVSSIPRWICVRFAELLKISVEVFQQAAEMAVPAPQRSYSAADRPTTQQERVTFDQVLIELGVPEEKRKALLADR